MPSDQIPTPPNSNSQQACTAIQCYVPHSFNAIIACVHFVVSKDTLHLVLQQKTCVMLLNAERVRVTTISADNGVCTVKVSETSPPKWLADPLVVIDGNFDAVLQYTVHPVRSVISNKTTRLNRA